MSLLCHHSASWYNAELELQPSHPRQMMKGREKRKQIAPPLKETLWNLHTTHLLTFHWPELNLVTRRLEDTVSILDRHGRSISMEERKTEIIGQDKIPGYAEHQPCLQPRKSFMHKAARCRIIYNS